MTLSSFWNQSINNFDNYADKLDVNDFVDQSSYDVFMQTMACNCTAFLKPVESGSKTEIAILKFLDKCGIDFEAYKSSIEVL